MTLFFQPKNDFIFLKIRNTFLFYFDQETVPNKLRNIDEINGVGITTYAERKSQRKAFKVSVEQNKDYKEARFSFI